MTKDQKRAQHALSKVREMLNKEASTVEEYTSYVRALPAKIVMNGLGQAMAMEISSAGKSEAHKFLFNHVAEWLLQEIFNDTKSPFSNLMDKIIGSDQKTYVRAQMEALAWLEWLKKFAVAGKLLQGEK